MFVDGFEFEKTFQCANQLGVWEPQAEFPKCVRMTSCLRQKLAAGENGFGPQCDAQGDFLPFQEDARTGERWCVDPQGNEIDGTRTGADVERTDCTAYARIPQTPKIPVHHDFSDGCVHWGDVWFKTFDGQIYGYGADGPLTLFKTQDDLFTVTLTPASNHGAESAKRWVEFRLTDVTSASDIVFTLRYKNGEPVIVTAGIMHELVGPIALDGGFEIIFDGEWVKVTNKVIYGQAVWMVNAIDGTIFIQIEPGLVSHGLCGNYDNDIDNDYLDKSGNCVNDPTEFADSWQTTCPVRPYWSTFNIVGAEERHVTFTNNMREAITLYWISTDGTWEKMADIESSESKSVTTYEQFAWIATTGNNRLVKLNNYCVFYALDVEGDQAVSVTDDKVEEGFAVHYEKKCNALAPVNGAAECKVFNGIKMCALTCANGFKHGHTTLYICNMETGIWAPELPQNQFIFPACHDGSRQCRDMEPPINGEVTCSVNDAGLHICVPSCPEFFEFSSPIPMSGYYACDDGEWTPSRRFPSCVPRVSAVDPKGIGHVTGVLSKEDVPIDQTGYCMTWGQHHYRTFDGKMFRFRGQCSYILAQDRLTGSFSIHVHNDAECDGHDQGKRSITIFMNDVYLDIKHNEEGEPAVFSMSGKYFTNRKFTPEVKTREMNKI